MGSKSQDNTLWKIFDDTKYFENPRELRKANLAFYKLFDCVMIFLLLVLYMSTFLSDYARSMRLVYVIFIICSALELFFIYSRRGKTDVWVMPMCYFGVAKAYLFCLLTSVFYNLHAPTITFYVFLILIPVCFTFRVRVMMAIQIFVSFLFCLSVVCLKDTDLILNDCVNCVIFMLIGIIMAVGAIQMRLDNYDMYRNTRILEENNNNILNSNPCGVLQLIFTGMQVDVLFANRAAVRLFGYTKEAFLAKKEWDFSEALYPEDVPLVAESLRNPVVGHSETYDFRLKNQEEDRYHWVSCKFLITEIEEAHITAMISLLDVDEKKKAESESEAKSRFLSRMSHEIRTPINAIMGMAELERQELREEHVDLAILENYANETTNASQYLLTLVNDILDTSRIDNDKIELHNGIIHAEKYLREVTNLIKPLADNKNITFRCERMTHFRDAYVGDGVRVQQILVNVLNNAIKFTPAGGSVTLTARAVSETADTTTLEFTVADTGIGMTEAFQKQLFKPFAQENSASTSPFAGTGLGLNIAKSLAKMMKGDIVCHSRQNEGTTFVITIVAGNAKEKDVKQCEAPERAEDIVWDFTGIRVLLCEDHPLNQKIAKALLERNNCTVELAGNGAEGVSMFAKHEAGYYDLILMDIRMPIMDGLQATAEIRRLDRPDAKTIPVVAMSANAFPEDIEKSLASGMNAHLAKPVDAKILNNTVAQYTGRLTHEQIIQKKDRILVVDDIEMNAAIIANMLKQDYEVLTASNGKEALAILNQSPDVAAVITDIQMPQMDGYELIREIRKNYQYDQIAILVSTQYSQKGRQEQSLLALGADDFVYKATSPNILVNRLRNVLARYEKNK